MNIEQEIIDWLVEAPYWLKYASQELLAGKECDNELISTTYKLFLEDNDLKEKEAVREDLEEFTPKTIISDKNVEYINSIHNIKNVNALEEDQKIKLSKHLTIIFGENGSGKSGYTRLLNNAFNSRGDKEILANINIESTGGEPECSFELTTSAGIEEVKFPEDENHKAFSQFSVFDSTSGVTQLTQENTLIFTPKGFDYFEKLMFLYNEVKTLLKEDITRHQKPNEFMMNFRFENSIQTFVSELSELTKIEDLKKYEKFEDKDQEQIETLIHSKKKLAEENIPKKIDDLSKRKTELIKLGETINAIKSKISKDDIENYNSLIDLKADLDKREKSEGIEMFKEFEIPNIGSREWKSFIESAFQYSILFKPLSEIQEKCPLCLQDLTDKEEGLFKSYIKLIKSQLQKEISEVKTKVQSSLKSIESLSDIKFNSSTMLYEFMVKNSPDLVPKIEALIENLNSSKENIKNGISNCKKKILIADFPSDIKFLNETATKINEQGKLLIEKDPSKELKINQDKINELTDRKILSQISPSIAKWLNELKWAKKANLALGKIKTNNITKKQGQLFEAQITNVYKTEFENECKIIRAPKVVEINQRNTKGTTLRRLQIKGNSANKILSEGEQKAISIADFLTENKLDSDNIGLIFDDPITSLDYKRRDLITKRLVEEAKNKQVVIFTHNISFLMRLQHFAGKADVDCITTTIRRVTDTVGVIKPSLPWIAQNVSKRVKYLRNELVKIEKIERLGDTDLYAKEIKSWYGLLREGWERAVEERLLKGVVLRFGLGVETQRLKRLIITDEFLQAIEKGMTESSNWAHDSAAALSPTLPTAEDAENSLKDFYYFCEHCKN